MNKIQEIKPMKNRIKDGFTLGELLIVVAIIGVLVAISIPVFSGQLEKAREATDLANVRSAYAEVMADAITENTSSETYNPTTKRYSKTVQLKQKVENFQTNGGDVNVAGITSGDKTHWLGRVLPEGDCTVYYDRDTDSVTLLWSDYSVKIKYQWIQNNGTLSLSSNLSSSSWPASSIPNAIDAKVDSGQSLVISSLSDLEDKDKTALTKAMKDGYRFEIGFFVTDTNGKIAVDHGYEVLSQTNTITCYISTDEKYLSKEAGADGANVNSQVLKTGDDCQVAIQIYKVLYDSDGNRTNTCVKMNDEEAAEITKLISFNKGTGN